MAVVGARVTVNTTATLIASEAAAGPNVTPTLIKNPGASAVYLGGSGVTAAAGFELAAGEVVAIDLSEDMYAITASGTQVVHVLSTRA